MRCHRGRRQRRLSGQSAFSSEKQPSISLFDEHTRSIGQNHKDTEKEEGGETSDRMQGMRIFPEDRGRRQTRFLFVALPIILLPMNTQAIDITFHAE